MLVTPGVWDQLGRRYRVEGGLVCWNLSDDLLHCQHYGLEGEGVYTAQTQMQVYRARLSLILLHGRHRMIWTLEAASEDRGSGVRIDEGVSSVGRSKGRFDLSVN